MTEERDRSIHASPAKRPAVAFILAAFFVAALVPIGCLVRSAYQPVPFGSGRMLRTQFHHSPDEGNGFGFRTIRTGADLELAFDAGGDRYSWLFDTFTEKHTYTSPHIGTERAKWPTRTVKASELSKRLRFKPLLPVNSSPFGLRDHELNWVNLNPPNSINTYNGVALTSQNYRPGQALCSKIYVRTSSKAISSRLRPLPFSALTSTSVRSSDWGISQWTMAWAQRGGSARRRELTT